MGKLLFELQDGSRMEPRRAGLDFHFGKGNNLFCTGGVCSARSEIKRQAELRARKGHFGEDKGHFGEPAEKWTWGHRLPDQVCCFSWAVFSPVVGVGEGFQRCCCIYLCKRRLWLGESVGSWKLMPGQTCLCWGLWCQDKGWL